MMALDKCLAVIAAMVLGVVCFVAICTVRLVPPPGLLALS